VTQTGPRTRVTCTECKRVSKIKIKTVKFSVEVMIRRKAKSYKLNKRMKKGRGKHKREVIGKRTEAEE
jgi:hypothetical protein